MLIIWEARRKWFGMRIFECLVIPRVIHELNGEHVDFRSQLNLTTPKFTE